MQIHFYADSETFQSLGMAWTFFFLNISIVTDEPNMLFLTNYHCTSCATYQLGRPLTLSYKNHLLENYPGKEHALLVCNHRGDIDWLIGWVIAQVHALLSHKFSFHFSGMTYMHPMYMHSYAVHTHMGPALVQGVCAVIWYEVARWGPPGVLLIMRLGEMERSI